LGGVSPFSVLLFGLFVFSGQVSVRFWFLALLGSSQQSSGEKVLVYGAGSTGRQLIKGLSEDRSFHCMGFIDDSPMMWGLSVDGVKVYRPTEIEAIIKQRSVDKVLLAIPSASFSERRKVLKRLESLPVQVQTVPSLRDIVSGSALIDQLNDVSIDDILGRDAVQPNETLLSKDVTGKTVLVTGAGGSIGSEICRQVLRRKPKHLVLFDISEFALYTIHQELEAYPEASDTQLHTILGSVQNFERVEHIMQRFSPDTVYHAAAYKHVPLVEHNMFEGVRNNVVGTLNAVRAAYESNVSKFVLISTDKAVRPTNVMGASKRFAELVVQAYAELAHDSVFCMVRFGNVLGSSGSVVPKFKAQIQQGGPITLTHKDITRYFMTIPEASQLVIQAGALAQGGEVFVLDMGEPVRIYDLACRLVHFSGLEVSEDGPGTGDIDIMVTGLRKGEKLYEELLIGDNAMGTSHSKIMRATEVKLDMAQLLGCLQQFDARLEASDFEGLRALLCSMPLAYSPTDEICDELFVANTSSKPNVPVVPIRGAS
jgi:FlaA1/EpsC-like NDP-sugar epimerase